MNNFFTKNKIIIFFSFLIIIILIIAINLHVFSRPRRSTIKPRSVTTLYFQPNKLSVASDKDFSLDVLVNPVGHKVSAAEIYLSFDPTKIQIQNITPSAAFSQELQATKIDNHLGLCSIIRATSFGQNVSVPTIVATLKFHTLDITEKTTLSFKDNSIITGDDEPGINLLKQKISAQIN